MADDSSEDTTVAEHLTRAHPVPPEKYRVGRELGRGGMGEVRLAEDAVIGREVAIKRLLGDKSSREHEARFIREARIQGRLDHPSIPPVYELGRDADGPYIVMKRLVGRTLGDILGSNDKSYSRERLLRAFVDVCLAIELAHSRGVVHRDLKPSNIMLGEFGEVYVLDWGIAKVLGDSDAGGDEGIELGSEDSTRTGAVIGTPSYMAPEQRLGRDVDGRADVYALGRLLAEILAGKRIRKAADEPARRPSTHAIDAAIPPELDELCVQATAEDRELRIARARVLADQVQAYLDGDRDLAQRRTLAAAHLERALEARKAGPGDAHERAAMREASRALALDPTLVAAADLVGRLMLEPPKELPPEVVAAVREREAVAGRQNARQGAFAYASLLLFLPTVALAGVRSATPIVALVALGAVLALVAAHAARVRDDERVIAFGWPAQVTLIGNALIVGLFARMFTTFFIAPSVAAIMAMILFRSIAFRRYWLVTTGCLALGVIVPWLGEATGVLESTTRFSGDGIWLHSPVLEFAEGPLIGGMITYTIGALIFIAVTSLGAARVQRSLDERVHLYAWRLRQLVPG